MQERDKRRTLFILYPKRWIKYPYNDHACRYRCFNPAADLKKMGYIADICVYQDFRKEYIDWYDTFIFHRPKYSRALERIISLVERKGKTFLADYDDLIFDPVNAFSSSLFLSGHSSEKTIIDLYSKNLKALRLFPLVTVSTTALKQEVERSHSAARVEVIHNGLSEHWVASSCSCRRSDDLPEPKRIAYFPGTSNHDHDFREVKDVLTDYLGKHRDVHLHIMGPLRFDRKSFPAAQVHMSDAVPYERLHKYMASSWVTIAPLHENSFNQCKSGLKFFESASLGIPVIASPIPDMVRFQGSGIFLADQKEAWHAAFDSLNDPETYRQISNKIKHFAINNCTSAKQTQKLAAFLESENGSTVPVRSNKGVRHREIYPAHYVNIDSEQTGRHRLKRKFSKLLKDPARFLSDSRHKSLRVIASMLSK